VPALGKRRAASGGVTVTVAGAIAIAVAIFALRPASQALPSPLSGESDATAPLPLPDVATDWCLSDILRGLDDSTCYFVPPDGPPPSRLLIYLSGIVPPVPRSPQKEKVQRIVAAAAKKAGAAAILPRGRRGIGPADTRDWWAWPTTPTDYGAAAKAIVAEWQAARSKLETALGGHRFERVYVAGSSSGAYFLAALAIGGGFEADGWAATSGGSPGLVSVAPNVVKKPFYVGYATGDPTNGAPKSLGAYLTNAGWPVRMEAHEGGHGAREEYLDEAFAFFRRFDN
jgi:predicted esterase